MGGLTLDTGALIALERTRKRIREIVAAAQAGKDPITVPAVAVTEWWRGPDKRRLLIRAMFDVEPLDEELARSAGEALASLRRGEATSTRA
jgi:predicted nucleic acid-binding protein